MKTFAKLNGMAFLYGFVMFIQTELGVNVYRLVRVMHGYSFAMNNLIVFMIFLISTGLFCYLTAKQFSTGMLRFILTVLWIPYYAFLVWVFPYFLPEPQPGDDPMAAVGLILILLLLIYPFYIGFINAIGSVIHSLHDRSAKHV